MNPRIRKIIILAALGLVALGGIVQGIQYAWRHGYSNGERTGIIRKLSTKGSPLCKVLSGELVVGGGTVMTAQAEVWEFTVDDESEDNPLVGVLHEAERGGKRVTLKYRQDQPMWWTCNPIEYKVQEVIQ